MLFFVLFAFLLISVQGTATWQEVNQIIEDSRVLSDVYFMAGNSSGVVHQYQKGQTGINTHMEIMSATKILATVVIMRQVEEGLMSLDDRPQKYLKFWTSDPADKRSQVTLRQLLSFTSGYGSSDPQCIAQNMELQECAELCFEQAELRFEPGAEFQYGSIHLQFAGAMTEVATGKRFAQLTAEVITEPLGLKETYFNPKSGNNPVLAYGILTTTGEYHRFWRAYFNDELLKKETRMIIEQDYTPNLRAGGGLFSYHYCLGNWFECDSLARWDPSCEEKNVHGSLGAFGFYPLVDRKLDYYLIIGVYTIELGSMPSFNLRHQLKPVVDVLMQ